MVNVSLIEAILREQDDPGRSTTRQMRDLYNIRSGEEPIMQHSDEDQEFQSILLKALEECPTVDDDEDKPISYTVKLKDSDDSSTPTMKRRSIIKLPKEAKEQSDSDETSSDSEKPSTASSITIITKPFSPLFLNNMKKYGVSSDWLSKRSNSLRQSAYSLSSVKSNTSKLDAMIKSASAKPIRSNRKLSFIETPPKTTEIDKENTDPSEETNENKKEEETTKKPSPYDLSSEVEEDKDEELSPTSKAFSLRIPRVNLPDEENKRLNSSSSSDEQIKQQKTKPKKKRRSKKEKTSTTVPKKEKDEQIIEETKTEDEEEQPTTDETKTEDKVEQPTTDETKKPTQKKDKSDQEQSRIEHLKKLLRISGIRHSFKKTELDELSSNRKKINYLKSIFDTAGFTGNLSIKECEKYRIKRDTEKELLEIQASAVDVKGHVKGGRTLRGQGRNTDESDFNPKRKRTASSEVEDDADDEGKTNNSNSSDNEKPIIKKRRILQMEPSPEVSENEL